MRVKVDVSVRVPAEKKQCFARLPTDKTLEILTFDYLVENPDVSWFRRIKTDAGQNGNTDRNILHIAFVADGKLSFAFAKLLFACHLLDDLLKNETGVIHHDKAQRFSERVMRVSFEQLLCNVCYLAGIVPNSRL